VRSPEQLRGSLLNIEQWIQLQLTTEITRPYKQCEDIGKILWGLLTFYRVRGILKYLLDADVEAFSADQAREALTYLTFLRAHKAGYDVPASRVRASTHGPFVSAVATGNFRLAAEIDELMPREYAKRDGEAPFAFATALRRLALGSESEIAAADEAVAEACADSEEHVPVVGVIHGLAQRDDDAFNEGLATYLASIESLPPEEATELRPGEEYVSVEALAFLQLAKKRNVRNRVKHRMIPPELQQAAPMTPTDGYPTWPG
jgi:hypothetical protein